MTKDQLRYSLMYQLKLLHKQYTNHVTIQDSENANSIVQEIIKALRQFRVARAILLNNKDNKILIWKTCDFAQKEKMEIIKSEAKLIAQLKSMGHEVEHNYRLFIVRNYDVCITTYHDIEHIFDYSAALIVLNSNMLSYAGIIFMNKQHINIYYGLEHKDPEFIHMLNNNYEYITIADNIKIHYCFKNQKLVKQYVIIDEFLTEEKINIIIAFIKNIAPRTPEKLSCMLEIVHLITSYTKEEMIEKISADKYQELQHLCNYKISDIYSTLAIYQTNRN